MEYLVKPWAHQQKSIERASTMNEFAFFYEVGAGKTLAAICAMRDKFYLHRTILRTLIFCPPIVITNWQREISMHTKLTPRQVCALTGSGKERLEKFIESKDKVHIYITNYETLLMEDIYEEFLLWRPNILIADESHRVKSLKAKRTKLLVKLAATTNYRYILSGTPILNTPMDIFAQYLVLDQGESFGKNFFAFRGKYFYDKNAKMNRQNYFPNWQIKPDAEERIKQIMFRKCDYVKKKDCLDLPPLVKNVITVGMTAQQKKHYDEMKQDYLTFIRGEACAAELAIVKALRLQQIVSGFIATEKEGVISTHSFEDNPRSEALYELLEDLAPHHKVIVWAVFHENYKQIREVCERLKVEYVEVHGNVSNKDAAVDAFNNDPRVRVLIGHPASGGIGINLVSSDVSIFFSRNFSLENDIQAEARNYRAGSEKFDKVTRYDLVCPNSIDEMILKKLESKQAMTGRILIDQILEEIEHGRI